jgi:hypothetical protein
MPELSLSLPPPACNELDVPQEEPGGRIVQASGSQGDRRAPSTVARDDESPMNSHKCSEDFCNGLHLPPVGRLRSPVRDRP